MLRICFAGATIVAMTYVLTGLGNPGKEYENTRHNTGRMVLDAFIKEFGADDWEYDKKLNAQKSAGKIGSKKFTLILPETFMNKSGNSLKSVITSKKKAETLVVVHDDIDIPFGKIKLSFGKNSGGHRGVESVMRAVKTKNFIRLRIGISPSTPKGKIKKPTGEEKIEKLILSKFTPQQLKDLKKIYKRTNIILETLISDGYQKAVSTM